MMTRPSPFGFPNPVNETSARLVAAGVVVASGLYLLIGALPILAAIAYGFWARLAAGPRFSPLGRVVTGWLTPRVEARLGVGRPVPGPPKRFAQGIGATLSTAALVAHLSGAGATAMVLVGSITVAATLESVFGYCLGCIAFGRLMAIGLIPEAVCQGCADINQRLIERASAADGSPGLTAPPTGSLSR